MSQGGDHHYVYTLNGKPLDAQLLAANEALEARRERERAAGRADALRGDPVQSAPDGAPCLLAHTEAVESVEAVWSEEAACGTAGSRHVEHRVHEQVWRERHTCAPYASQMRGALRSEHGELVQDVDVPIDCTAYEQWANCNDGACIEIVLWRVAPDGGGSDNDDDKRAAVHRCQLPPNFVEFMQHAANGGVCSSTPSQSHCYVYRMDEPLVLHFRVDDARARDEMARASAEEATARALSLPYDYERMKRAASAGAARPACVSLVRIAFPDPRHMADAPPAPAHRRPRTGQTEANEASALARARAAAAPRARWNRRAMHNKATRRGARCGTRRTRSPAASAKTPVAAWRADAAPAAPVVDKKALRTKLLDNLPPLPAGQQEEICAFAVHRSPQLDRKDVENLLRTVCAGGVAGCADGAPALVDREVLAYLENYSGLERRVRTPPTGCDQSPSLTTLLCQYDAGMCEPFSRMSISTPPLPVPRHTIYDSCVQ